MAAGHWLIFTINDAGETVHLAKIECTNAADDEVAVVSNLREFVWRGLSTAERDTVMRTDDGGIYMEVRKTDTGFTAGTGPTYGAKFIDSV